MRDVLANDEAGEGSAGRIAAFGRWLTQERELRGLCRAAVVERTKLPPSLVEALESGDESRMPPSAYVIGYLRSYAAAVGLDADEVVLRWQETAAPPPPRGATASRAPSARVLAAAILALAAAGAAAWAIFAGG